MSLADPLTVTLSTVPHTLPRTSSGEDASEYRNADGTIMLTVSHTYGKRTRRMIRIDSTKIAADVFKPDENVKKSMSNYIVFDTDSSYTNAEIIAVWEAFIVLLTANQSSIVKEVLGGES